MDEIKAVWQQCLVLLKDQYGQQDYNTWFRFLRAHYVNGKVQVTANNRLVQDFVRTKYWPRISGLIKELSGGLESELKVALSEYAKLKESSSAVAETVVDNPDAAIVPILPTNSSHQKAIAKDQELLSNLQYATQLNKNYTFDNLVCGNSNQMAYAIGRHVMQKPGNKNHNPLFIYGGVGLGKTHLMQAIGNEIYKNNPRVKIRYLHANDYIQDVVKASMRQGFDELKKYYNNLELLLLDDIQFIAGDKTKTQEELFYMFNTLLDRNKQVILTCDTYPKNISKLNERLISRFASGLTVEIQPPELEMRIAILKRKAELHHVLVNDEVAFFIAQNIKSNVRELEGALNKVIYQAQFSGKRINIDITKEALMDILALEKQNTSIDDIQKAICDFYKIRISDLLSAKRHRNFVRPRQIAMSITKELTQHSLPAIGSAFGGRDHTTVLHAQRVIKTLRSKDEKIDREYNLLLQMLKY